MENKITLEEGRKKRRRKKLEFVKINNKNNNIIPTYLSYEILYHYFIGSISVYYNDVMYFMRIRYFVENEETCNTTDVFVIICRFSIYIFLCKYTLIFLDILKILAIILLPRNKDNVKYNCNIDVVVLNVFN